MKKHFKEPHYLVQINKKFCQTNITKIFWYEHIFIKDVQYITYHSYQYSDNKKKEILMELCERWDEFDKIFETLEEATHYVQIFEKNFKKYYENLNCRINMVNLMQKRNNMNNGISDLRLFDKTVDAWRYS